MREEAETRGDTGVQKSTVKKELVEWIKAFLFAGVIVLIIFLVYHPPLRGGRYFDGADAAKRRPLGRLDAGI